MFKRFNEKLTIIGPILLLVITICFIVPSTIYLTNINEFLVSYWDVIENIITFVLVIVILSSLFMILVSKNDILFRIINGLIFGLAISAYLQINFLNKELRVLDGAEVALQPNPLLSIVVWTLIIIACIVISVLFGKTSSKWFSYISYFLIIVQIIFVAVLLLTIKKAIPNDFVFSKNNQFELSKNENIVVFVVDTLDALWFEEDIVNDYSSEANHYRETLNDFTYFNDVVAGGAPTFLGVPKIFTDVSFNPYTMEIGNYMYNAYNDNTDFFDDLKSNNFDIQVYTSQSYFYPNIYEYINNVVPSTYKISNNKEFSSKLKTLVLYYVLPNNLKDMFKIYTEDLTNLISSEDSEVYTIDDPQFYQDFVESKGIKLTNNKKTFVLYHLFGPHGPFTMNENCEKIDEKDGTRKNNIYGCFKIIDDFIESMKENEIYENSTIIITADHGGGNTLYQNPAVLVKLPNMHSNLSTNSACATFTNLRATIMSSVLEDYSKYGQTLFDEIPYTKYRYHAADHKLRVFFNENKEKSKFYFDPYLIGVPARDMSKTKDVQEGILEIDTEYYLFGPNYNVMFNLEGLGDVEKDNRWSISKEINLEFFNDEQINHDLILTLSINKIIDDNQIANIYVNDVLVGSIDKLYIGINQIVIPHNYFNDSNIQIKVELPNALIQSNEDGNTQELSISLKNISLKES